MSVYTYMFFSEWQADFNTYQQTLHQMAKVYQRVIVGKVEMDHPNRSTSHVPEITKHIWLKTRLKCLFNIFLFNDAGSSPKMCIIKKLYND